MTTAAMPLALTAWMTRSLNRWCRNSRQPERIEDLARENGQLGAELERSCAEIHASWPEAACSRKPCSRLPAPTGMFLDVRGRAWTGW